MIYFLSKNKKNKTIFHLKIIVFTAVKYQSKLHLYRRVFVMLWLESSRMKPNWVGENVTGYRYIYTLVQPW